MAEQDGVNIPVTSTADAAGFDAMAAAGVQLGARLKELQGEEAKASAPVAPPVSVPGAPAAQKALQDVGTAGAEAGKKTTAELGEVDKFLHTLQEDAGKLGGAFKAGLGIGAAQVLIGGLEEAIAKVREFAAEGVEVNKEFESLGVGLASSLRQADAGRYSDFNEALKTSADLIQTVREKALELNLDAGELGHNLQVNMLSLVEGGIHDINQQVETTGLLMQAAAAKGVVGFQAVRDVIDILNGKAERVILSKELGITNEDIARAKEAGDLAGYLAAKLGAYREAAAATRETLAGLQQQESTLGKNLAGQLSAGLFQDAKEQAQGMVQALNSPEVKEAALVFSQILGDVGGIQVAAGDLLRIVAAIAVTAGAVLDPLAFITAHINAATAESAKLGESYERQTRALQDQLQHADSLEKKVAARSALEDAAAAAEARAAADRRESQFDDAELSEQQATLLRRMLETFDQTAGKVVQIGTHEESRRATMEAQQKALEGQLAAVDKLDKALAAQADRGLKDLNPAELRSRLNAQLQNAQDLLREGGVNVPLDVQLTGADQIAKLRDQLNPTAANYSELRAKISETGLEVLKLSAAYDTASASSAREADAAKKDGDKMIADRRAFIAALGQEGAERDELTRAQKELASAQSAADRDSEAGQKRIREAVEAVTQAQRDLAKAEADREAAANKAFPAETARLNEIANLLRNMPATGTEATADARAVLQNEARALQDQRAGKAPAKSLDDLDRESAQRADDGAAQDQASLNADAARNIGQSAVDVGQTAEALGEAAGQQRDATTSLRTQGTALQTAFGTFADAQSQYHGAVLDGLSGHSELLQTAFEQIGTINGQIAQIKAEAAQRALQLDNLADSGGDD